MDLGQAKLRVTVDSSGAKSGADEVNSAFAGMLEQANKTLETIAKQGEHAKESFQGLIEKAKEIAEVFAVVEFAKGILEAGSEAENLKIKLTALTGSAHEAAEMFEHLQQYTSKTAFQFKDVGEAATQLTGVFRGNVEAVQAWIPLIGDLAAATGQTVDETTTEIIRMMTQGGNGAGAFRDRGLAAMLDLERGVSYSATAIRDKLIDAWEGADSKFRGTAVAMGQTWSGATAQMGLAWDMFKEHIAQAGVLDFVKAIVQVITDDFNHSWITADDNAKLFGADAIVALSGVVKAVGVVIQATKFLIVTWEALKVSADGIGLVWDRIAQAASTHQATVAHEAVLAVQANIDYAKSMLGVQEGSDAMIAMKADLRQAMVEETKAWLSASEAADNYAKDSDKTTKSTDDLFAAFDSFSKGIDIDKFLDDVTAKFHENQNAADQSVHSHERLQSSLRDYAVPINSVAMGLAKLKAAQQENIALQQKMNEISGQAGGALDPVSKAWAEYAKQVSETYVISTKWVELATKFPALGISEAQIRQQVTQAILLEGQARDQAIAKAEKEADVIAKFERQLKADNSLDDLDDKQKAIQKAVNDVTKAFEDMDVGLQKLHPLTQQSIDDLKAFVSASYDQKQSIEFAKQIITDYANVYKTGFSSMADDTAKFFTGQIKNWSDFRSAIVGDVQKMIADIIAQYLKLAIINPILNSMFGSTLNLPTYGNAASGFQSLAANSVGGSNSGLLGMFFNSGNVGGAGNGSAAGGGALSGGSGSGGSIFSGIGSWFDSGKSLFTNLGSLWSGTGVAGSSAFGTSIVSDGLDGLPATTLGYTPSTLGAGLGIAGGAYAAYNEYKDAGGGAAGIVGGAAYGIGTVTAAGAIGGVLSGAGAAAGAAGGLGTIGLGAIPVVGWIALAAMGINMLTGGGLFGTSWKPTGSELNVDLDQAGASVTEWLDESKKKALFGGTSHKTVGQPVDQATKDTVDGLFTNVQAAVKAAATQLSTTAGDLVTGSFHEMFDKKGKMTSEITTILGKSYSETLQDFASRVTAENLIALLPAAQGAEAIADQWKSSASKLLDGSEMLVQAQIDINHGVGLEGAGTTLANVADVIQQLNQAGETLVQTYTRVSMDTQSFQKLIDLMGVSFGKSGNDLVKFAAGVETSAGGQSNEGALLSSFYQSYFTPKQLAQYQLGADQKSVDTSISNLGSAGAGLTFDNFKQRFEDVVNTLSPDDVINWLKAGQALAAVNTDLTNLGTSADNTAALESFQKLLDLTGVSLGRSGAALLKFAGDITTAAGGQSAADKLFSNYATEYYTPDEVNKTRYNEDKATADTDVAGLGDAGKGLTFENFRTTFEKVVNTLTPADVVKWLQAGNALSKVNDDLKALPDPAKQLKDTKDSITAYGNVFKDYADQVTNANKSYTQVMSDNKKTILDSIKAYDGSATAQQNLISTLQDRYKMELQYLALIDTAAKTVHDTLSSAIEGIKTSQMSPEQKYNYYKDQADADAKLLASTTDPQKISDLVKKIQGEEQNAWSTLSPDQQKVEANKFIAFLQGVQDEADTQLGKAKQGVTDDNKTLSQAVNDALTAAAAKQQAAADLQNSAAIAFSQAVGLFTHAPVRVQVVTERGKEADVGGYRK